MIETVRRVTGKEFKVRETARREGDPPQLIAAVDRAKELLAHASIAISDVAIICGFADQSHFTRMFKRTMRLLCGVPADAGLYVAMNRQMLERVLALDNPRPHLVAMIGCAGLPVVSIPVRRAERAAGRSAYTSWDRLGVAWGALTWALAHKLRTRGARI